MTMQLKYYYTFKGLDNSSYKVEIYQDTTAVLTPEEIRGDNSAFTLEYPQVKKTDVFHSSGGDITLLSTVDRKYLDLYTANMLEYQVRFYKNNLLYWLGYLDSELYQEPFNEVSNYPVSFTVTDGFSLLNRINYCMTDGSKYAGIVSQWQVVKNCLTKLNLPYQSVRVSLSTTSSSFVIGSSETLLHKVFCNNQNYYNEDGDAETCRKVLEAVLKPYNAVIKQGDGSLYITDINTLAAATTAEFKVYDSGFNYVGSETLDLGAVDITQQGLTSSDLQLTVVAGTNKQLVKFSPYISTKILDYNADDDVFTNQINTTTIGEFPYRWQETTYKNSRYWLNDPLNVCTFAKYSGLDFNDAESDSYLRLENNPLLSGGFTYTPSEQVPLLIPTTNQNYYLKVQAKCYVRTVDDLNGTTPTTIDARVCQVPVNIVVDQQSYTADGWEAGTGNNFYWTFENASLDTSNTEQITYSNTSISDKWTNLKQHRGFLTDKPKDLFIPLWGFAGNNFTVIIKNNFKVYNDLGEDITVNIIDLRLKDISFTVVDSSFNEVKNTDVEYIAYMNPQYQNAGADITLLQGTATTSLPTTKAALLYKDANNTYQYLQNFSRAGVVDCVENLLLRSIKSNDYQQTLALTAEVNIVNTVFSTVKYSSQLPNTVFMIVGGVWDFQNACTKLTLQEIKTDTLDINKV